MNEDLRNYINSGANMVKNLKHYMILLSGPMLITPFVFIGFEGFCEIFLIFMISVCLLIVFIGIILFRKKGIISKLWCQMLIAIHWILQFLTIQILLFVDIFGWNIGLIILILPLMVFPIILTKAHGKRIKDGSFSFKKKNVGKKISIIGFFGVFGVYFLIKQTILRRINWDIISQFNITILLILLLLLVNMIFSIGLLGFHKIYLCRKLNFTNCQSDQSIDQGQSGNSTMIDGY